MTYILRYHPCKNIRSYSTVLIVDSVCSISGCDGDRGRSLIRLCFFLQRKQIHNKAKKRKRSAKQPTISKWYGDTKTEYTPESEGEDDEDDEDRESNEQLGLKVTVDAIDAVDIDSSIFMFSSTKYVY